MQLLNLDCPCRWLKTSDITPTALDHLARLEITCRKSAKSQPWNQKDLEQKLEQLKTYYNEFRVHQSLNGATPEEKGGGSTVTAVSLEHYDWQRHCHGFFQLPIAA